MSEKRNRDTDSESSMEDTSEEDSSSEEDTTSSEDSESGEEDESESESEEETDFPSAADLEACRRTLAISLPPGSPKAASVEKYLSFVQCTLTFPIRLQVKGASLEEVKNYPAALTLLGGKSCSGWVQAMWSAFEKGIPPEGVLLTAMEGVPQSLLFDLTVALHTGTLTCCTETVVQYLLIADYLQIGCLISPLYGYVAKTLLLKSPRTAIELARQFELSTALDDKTLFDHICEALREGHLYLRDVSDKLNSRFWKDLHECLAAPEFTLEQLLPLITDAALSAPQVVYSILQWARNANATDACASLIEKLWKRLQKSISPPEAQILLEYLPTQKLKKLSPGLKDAMIQLYDMLIKARHSTAQAIVLSLNNVTGSDDWTQLEKKRFGKISSKRSRRFGFRWPVDNGFSHQRTSVSGHLLRSGDLEVKAEDRISVEDGFDVVVACLRQSHRWNESPVLCTRRKYVPSPERSAIFDGLLDEWQRDLSLRQRAASGGSALMLYIGVYLR